MYGNFSPDNVNSRKANKKNNNWTKVRRPSFMISLGRTILLTIQPQVAFLKDLGVMKRYVLCRYLSTA